MSAPHLITAEPRLVDRAAVIRLAGGCPSFIRRGLHHKLLVSCPTPPGAKALFRLADVDAFIEKFIFTGRIRDRDYWLPDELRRAQAAGDTKAA